MIAPVAAKRPVSPIAARCCRHHALEQMRRPPQGHAQNQHHSSHLAYSLTGEGVCLRQDLLRGDYVQILDDLSIQNRDAFAAGDGGVIGVNLAACGVNLVRRGARRLYWRFPVVMGGSASCRQSPCRGPVRIRRAAPRRRGRRYTPRPPRPTRALFAASSPICSDVNSGIRSAR